MFNIKQNSEVNWKTLVRLKNSVDKRKRCPFDESHNIAAEKPICPYNPCHVVDLINFAGHKQDCVDRRNNLKASMKLIDFPYRNDKIPFSIWFGSGVMLRDTLTIEKSIKNNNGAGNIATRSIFHESKNAYNSAIKISNKSLANLRKLPPTENLKINTKDDFVANIAKALDKNNLLSKTIIIPIKTVTHHRHKHERIVSSENKNFGCISSSITCKERLKNQQKTSKGALETVLITSFRNKQIFSEYLGEYSSGPIKKKSTDRPLARNFKRPASASAKKQHFIFRQLADAHNAKLFDKPKSNYKLNTINSSAKKTSAETQKSFKIFSNAITKTFESIFGSITKLFAKRSKKLKIENIINNLNECQHSNNPLMQLNDILNTP